MEKLIKKIDKKYGINKKNLKKIEKRKKIIYLSNFPLMKRFVFSYASSSVN